MYREDQSGGSFMLGVLAGAFVGAGLALLFAPKTGTEMRAQLGEQYRGLADRVGEQTQNLRTTAGQWRDQGRERMQQLSSRLSDRTSPASEYPGTSAATEDERFPSSAPSV
jgi:gas vesicle protein